MAASAALLDACARFAAEVSPEATAHVVRLLETEGATRAGVGLSGDAALRYGELLSAWSNSPNMLPASDVANLLCGAAHAVAAERRRQRVELVWSGPNTVSSTLRSTGPALLELIRGAHESVYLVTFAAYKVPEVAEALADAARRKVRLVFVLETDTASGGKVDFDPLPHLAAELARPLRCTHGRWLSAPRTVGAGTARSTPSSPSRTASACWCRARTSPSSRST